MMRTRVFVAIGAALGVMGVSAIHYQTHHNPIALCMTAVAASNEELDRMNQAAGMKPQTPFSIDDYCGYNCGPDNECLDACRSCLDDAAGRGQRS